MQITRKVRLEFEHLCGQVFDKKVLNIRTNCLIGSMHTSLIESGYTSDEIGGNLSRQYYLGLDLKQMIFLCMAKVKAKTKHAAKQCSRKEQRLIYKPRF